MKQSSLMLKNVKAIIFDLDGVVIDSEPVHTEARQFVCRKYDIECPSEEWDSFGGKTVTDIFEYLIKNYSNDKNLSAEKLAKEKTEKYLELAFRKLDLFPGVIDLIKKARDRGFKISLVTSGRKSVQVAAFQKFNLDKYFGVIVTRSDFEKGKPDPEPYNVAIKKMGLGPEECLAIEDSFNGVLSAKASGCVTVGITTSLTREKLEKAGADHVAETFEEIANILGI